MASNSRKIVSTLSLGGEFEAFVYDTDFVQVMAGDTRIAALSKMDSALMAEGVVEQLLEGCVQLYQSEKVTVPSDERNGDRTMILDYAEGRYGLLVRKILASSKLSPAEKFAVIVSALSLNVHEVTGDEQALAAVEASWRLEDFEDSSLPWGANFNHWLLPTFKALLSSFKEPPKRFSTARGYPAYLKLMLFAASESTLTFGEFKDSITDLPLFGSGLYASDPVIGSSLPEPVLLTTETHSMDAATLRSFYAHHISPPTLPLLKFQAERARTSVLPLAATTDELSHEALNLNYWYPEASRVLSASEHEEFSTHLDHASPLFDSFESVALRGTRPRLLLLALSAKVGCSMAIRLMDEFIATMGPWEFDRRVTKQQAFEDVLSLGDYDYTVTNPSWVVAISTLVE